VCCSVLQHVAVRGSVLQYVTVCVFSSPVGVVTPMVAIHQMDYINLYKIDGSCDGLDRYIATLQCFI